MNQPWSDLPNAHHIDWVLRSLKDDPGLWTAASDAASGAASDAAWYAASGAAGTAAWDVAWAAAWAAAWDVARDVAWAVARDAAYNAARDAILALVAYDDCDEYLKMSYEELRIWAALSQHPAAILLRPMTYVREKIHEPALV